MTDGENALLVPPESSHQITEQLKQLKEDEDLRKNLSRNGQGFVEKNISWNSYGRENVTDIHGSYQRTGGELK
ncbi:hypothetical protein M1N13_00060 [Dehalococcoidia bacterium]|nr:hypothetical protein [Dehalococcoidia bacterium]